MSCFLLHCDHICTPGFVVWLALMTSVHSMDNYWTRLSLPDEHVPYYFYSHHEDKNLCEQDPSCPYQKQEDVHCWGYEKGCVDTAWQMSQPECPGDFPYGWVKTKAEQVQKFWNTADFGYVKERFTEMTVLCQPRHPDESYFACAKYTQYCRAKNIVLDFTTARIMEGHNQYREDIFKSGQIGGSCVLDREKLSAEGEHKSPLQSWFAEVEHYSELPFSRLEEAGCDVILDKPTILIKLDAGVNMYHHFCDFVNLYAAQHINGSWSRDVNIIMWNTSPMKYGDFFHDTWKAFSDHPIIHLNSYDKKKLCIRDAVFSLLARMRYGLYYNMPLDSKIRVTVLSRSSKYRRILNEAELVHALKSVDRFEVKVVDYNGKYPFLDQLQMTHNSDIFIGMHGAGLTHLLFQPDWAVIFELYNCDDVNCYKDLARLRGIHYVTWVNADKLMQEDEGHHPQLGAHKKFTNYAFDVDEFLRLVTEAAQHVENHPKYQAAINRRREMSRDEL